MILDAIISIVTTILDTAFSALPVSSLGFLSGAGNTFITMGTTMRPWAGLIPIGLMLGTLGAVINIMFPLTLTYKALNWAYKHIPQIGGFGPGSG